MYYNTKAASLCFKTEVSTFLPSLFSHHKQKLDSCFFYWWNHEQRPDLKIINETRARWAAHLAINKTLCRPSSSITVLFRSTWHLACLIVCKNPFIASCSPCKWNGSLFGCFCLFLDKNKYPIPCGSDRGWQPRRKSFSFHHRLNHNSQAKNIPCTHFHNTSTLTTSPLTSFKFTIVLHFSFSVYLSFSNRNSRWNTYYIFNFVAGKGCSVRYHFALEGPLHM